MTDTSKQLGEHKHCCERIFYAMTKRQDALAVKVLRDELAKARAEERSKLLLELLQMFNDYDVPLTMTAEQVRDILEAYLTKKE